RAGRRSAGTARRPWACRAGRAAAPSRGGDIRRPGCRSRDWPCASSWNERSCAYAAPAGGFRQEPEPGYGLRYTMSSTPSSHPAVKVTVSVVDGCVQPVVTICIEPVVIDCVLVCPRLSVSVSVPAAPVNTRILTSVLGPGEKANVREVPELDAK